MKALIWIIIALVVIGGIAYFMSSQSASSGSSSDDSNSDALSENGRVIDTDTAVFDEIDDALAGLG